MSGQHTPEPWVFNIDSTCSGAWPEFGTYDENYGFMDIGRVGTSYVFDHENFDQSKIAVTYQEAPHCFKLTSDGEEMIANARRIVACVNACAGIQTDDLEQCPSGGLFHIADHANELVKQRDELLAALEAIEPFIPKSSAKEGGATAYSANVRAADIVRDAIASVKGGA